MRRKDCLFREYTIGCSVRLVDKPKVTGVVVSPGQDSPICKVQWNENDLGYDDAFWIGKHEIELQ